MNTLQPYCLQDLCILLAVMGKNLMHTVSEAAQAGSNA